MSGYPDWYENVMKVGDDYVIYCRHRRHKSPLRYMNLGLYNLHRDLDHNGRGKIDEDDFNFFLKRQKNKTAKVE